MALYRSLATLLAVAALVVSAGSATDGPDVPGGGGFAVDAHWIAGDSGVTIDARARAAITWRGGAITTSTGEQVNVFVSDLLPAETPEKWAELLVGLTHGSELSRVTARIATLEEVQQLCGARALGCYVRGEMISPGQATTEAPSTPEEVLRHEYGHHIAVNRTNAPWRAATWGPKHWASAAGVCARVTRGEAFPGDAGRFYSVNPGEAWAEVYRLLDERKAGVTTANWPIIARSFFPDEAALAAAERDVLAPWTANRTRVFRRVFGKATRRVWWIPVRTPLDGELSLTATLPRNGTHEVALVAADRRTVFRRAQPTERRVRRASATICGRRSLFVRVTVGAPGRAAVTLSTP